jgi:hypothetical protein
LNLLRNSANARTRCTRNRRTSAGGASEYRLLQCEDQRLSTRILTRDDVEVIVPNSEMANKKVVNQVVTLLERVASHRPRTLHGHLQGAGPRGHRDPVSAARRLAPTGRFMIATNLLLATLLLTGSALANIDATASAHEYYPLRIGNSWTYVSTVRGEFTNSVVDTTRTDGELWFRTASTDARGVTPRFGKRISLFEMQPCCCVVGLITVTHSRVNMLRIRS